MSLNPSHFAEIHVGIVPCAEPLGTFVKFVTIKIGDEVVFSSSFPIARYTALYPAAQVKLEDLDKFHSVESSFDFNELANALERVILSVVNRDIAGIICSPAQFDALKDFLVDFSREYIDVSSIEDLILSERLAHRIYNQQ